MLFRPIVTLDNALLRPKVLRQTNIRPKLNRQNVTDPPAPLDFI